VTWHPYNGGGRPVAGDAVIEAKTSTGIIGPCRAVDLSWDEGGVRILAWREAVRPIEPDCAAFWRGLIVGGCISACIWLAAAGGVWAVFEGCFPC
jgi:hypothetical protein